MLYNAITPWKWVLEAFVCWRGRVFQGTKVSADERSEGPLPRGCLQGTQSYQYQLWRVEVWCVETNERGSDVGSKRWFTHFKISVPNNVPLLENACWICDRLEDFIDKKVNDQETIIEIWDAEKLVKTKYEQLKGVVKNKIKTLSSVVQKEVNFRKMLQVQ